jgi:hypothetical protein
VSEFEKLRDLFHFRLFRVDFPWVKIKQISVFLSQDEFHPNLEKWKRDQPKIATSSPWQNTTPQLNITDGKFVKDFGFSILDFRFWILASGP